MHGHEHARRVVEVALGELDARLVVEAHRGQAPALQEVERRLDAGQEDGEAGEERDEDDLQGDHACPSSRLRSRALQAVHGPVVGLVVVAQHVEEAVEREHVELLPEGPPEAPGRFARPSRTLITMSPSPASPPSPGKDSTSVGRSLPR